MAGVNIHEAKTQLSRLVDQAAAGKDVVIARGGKPGARLTCLPTAKQPLHFGLLKGKVNVAADFDATLRASVLAEFAAR